MEIYRLGMTFERRLASTVFLQEVRRESPGDPRMLVRPAM